MTEPIRCIWENCRALTTDPQGDGWSEQTQTAAGMTVNMGYYCPKHAERYQDILRDQRKPPVTHRGCIHCGTPLDKDDPGILNVVTNGEQSLGFICSVCVPELLAAQMEDAPTGEDVAEESGAFEVDHIDDSPEPLRGSSENPAGPPDAHENLSGRRLTGPIRHRGEEPQE